MSVVNQKRIAKNTALLYVRMLFIMLISLYTSRVILATLGKIDFGLYGVVGGIVVTFSFLNGIMSAACQRYFAIELGRNDNEALSRVFKLNVTIFLGLGVIIILLAETIGLWVLNHKMIIPPDRMIAAQWVYQCSIVSFMINMIATPYRSIIIAKEKMKVFAYASVIEAVLKLAIVYLLAISPFDKLAFYAVLMLAITIGTNGFNYFYCNHFYKECHYSFYWNKSLFKEIIGYTGWNLIGNLSGIGKSQGINILLNMFFGPTVNAARYLAFQIYININQFVSNFMIATTPQITKAYANNEHDNMMKLIFQSSRFSYYLLFILTLPLLFETSFILDLWLEEIPVYTALFTRLVLVNALLDSLQPPISSAAQATGKVKWYQLTVGMTLLMILPTSYVFLKLHLFGPQGVFYVAIVFAVIAHIFRVIFMKRELQMSVSLYFKDVLLKIILVTIISSVLPIVIFYTIPAGWLQFIIVTSVSIIASILTIYYIGITANERLFIIKIIKNKLFKGKIRS